MGARTNTPICHLLQCRVRVQGLGFRAGGKRARRTQGGALPGVLKLKRGGGAGGELGRKQHSTACTCHACKLENPRRSGSERRGRTRTLRPERIGLASDRASTASDQSTRVPKCLSNFGTTKSEPRWSLRDADSVALADGAQWGPKLGLTYKT